MTPHNDVPRLRPSSNGRSGLALFFTLGVRLADWERTGYLDREIAYYQRLAEHVGPITFITYGAEEDQALAERLGDIRLLTNDERLPSEMFMRQAPRLLQDSLKSTAIIKSNQIKGAGAVVQAASQIGARSVIRGGYLLSRFISNQPISLRMRFGLWRHELAMFHQADRVMLPTCEDAIYARRWYALPVEKVVVVPNFVDVDLFAPRDDVPCEPGLIGFVGRLAPQKNLRALIEAVSGLHNVRLRLIGDGPQRAELESFAKSCNVVIEFCGSVPHQAVSRLLAECELFILPSLYEGLPKALLEAMAAGVPVITTRVQGSSPLIQHRENGWLCNDASVASLRHGIETLLRDSRLRAQMSRSARRYIVEHFSLSTVLSREIAVYQEMGCV